MALLDQLRESFDSAFPTPDDQRRLFVELGGQPGAEHIVDFAIRQNRVADLLGLARRLNPLHARLQEICALLVALGAVDDHPVARPTLPPEVLGEAPGAGPVTLQSMLMPSVPLVDVADWRKKMELAERSVCRIEVQTSLGTNRGTGFLVAPDIVMTNYHVLRSVPWKTGDPPLDPSNPPVLVEPKSVQSIEFGYYRGVAPGVEAVCHATEILAADPILDFALVRIDQQFAGDRALKLSRYLFSPQEPAFILQHPEDNQMKLGVGMVTKDILDPTGKQDLRLVAYTTNTLPGSSGSPCFSMTWTLAGLHFGAQSNANLARRVSAILDYLEDPKHDAVINLTQAEREHFRSSNQERVLEFRQMIARASNATQGIVSGIRAFQALQQGNAVGPENSAVLAILPIAERQMRVVIEYKRIHDALHEIIVKVSNPLAAALSTKSPSLKEDVADFLKHLDAQIDRIRAIETRAREQAMDHMIDYAADLAQELTNRKEDLASALRTGNASELVQEESNLDNEIALRWFSANERLSVMSGNLPLQDLAQALANSLAELSRGNAPTMFASRLGKAVEELNEFGRVFVSQLASHNAWQSLDRKWRSALSADIDSFERAWLRDLRGQIMALQRTRDDQWARDLAFEVYRIDSALVARNTTTLADAKCEIAAIALEQFYRVDQDYLQLCESLQPIADVIRDLLRNVNQ